MDGTPDTAWGAVHSTALRLLIRSGSVLHIMLCTWRSAWVCWIVCSQPQPYLRCGGCWVGPSFCVVLWWLLVAGSTSLLVACVPVGAVCLAPAVGSCPDAKADGLLQARTASVNSNNQRACCWSNGVPSDAAAAGVDNVRGLLQAPHPTSVWVPCLRVDQRGAVLCCTSYSPVANCW
jgi:hypothetical protein